jgi:hypothetical protein
MISSEALAKNRLIEEILQHVQGHQHAAVRKELETRTIPHLENTLVAVIKEAKGNLEKSQSALLEEQATRAAEKAAWNLQHHKPQRDAAIKAQYDKDTETFRAAAARMKSVGVTMANLQLVIEGIGSVFSQEMAEEFIETNNSLMSPPTPHELNGYKYAESQTAKQIESQRVEYLKNMPHEQLREVVKAEGQKSQAAAAQSHAQQQLQVRAEKEQGFPPLPQVDDQGRVIDSGYVIRLSNAPISSADYRLFRHLCRRFGFAAVTRRLNGLG